MIEINRLCTIRVSGMLEINFQCGVLKWTAQFLKRVFGGYFEHCGAVLKTGHLKFKVSSVGSKYLL